MAKWGFIARARAIDGYDEYRSDLMIAADDEYEFDIAKSIVRDILARAKAQYISARETPHDYRIIKKCERFLDDFT